PTYVVPRLVLCLTTALHLVASTRPLPFLSSLFFLTDTAPTHIYTLSLHDALPISSQFRRRRCSGRCLHSWRICRAVSTWYTGTTPLHVRPTRCRFYRRFMEIIAPVTHRPRTPSVFHSIMRGGMASRASCTTGSSRNASRAR